MLGPIKPQCNAGLDLKHSKSYQDGRRPENPRGTSRVQSRKRLLRSKFCSENIVE